MKKVLLSLVGSGLLVGTAGAALYTDLNSYGLTEINKSSPVSGEFDITGGPFGYKPSSDQLSDASATFVFADTDLNTESLTISLANSPVGVVSSSFGAMVSASTLSDLISDGKLSFTINAISVEAYLKSAALSAKGGDRCPGWRRDINSPRARFAWNLCARRKFVSAY